MFSIFKSKQTRKNERNKKIEEIRTMIQTHESKYIFPAKEYNIKYDYNYNKYILHNVKQYEYWESYSNPLLKNVLIPLSKDNIKFDSFDSFKDWILTPNKLEEINNNIINNLYNILKNVQITHFENENIKNIRALLNYEKIPYLRNEPLFNNNGTLLNNISVRKRISNLIEKQEPLDKEIIVWRGQTNTEISSSSWFSSSLKKDIAKKYGKDLFKIHIQPGIKIIDLYEYYAKHGIKNPVNNTYKMRAYMRNYKFIYPHSKYFRNYYNYKEIIVQQNGTFYKDINKLEQGFTPIYNKPCKDGTCPILYYETYYFPSDKITQNNTNIIINTNKLNTTKRLKNRELGNISRLFRKNYPIIKQLYPTNKPLQKD